MPSDQKRSGGRYKKRKFQENKYSVAKKRTENAAGEQWSVTVSVCSIRLRLRDSRSFTITNKESATPISRSEQKIQDLMIDSDEEKHDHPCE